MTTLQWCMASNPQPYDRNLVKLIYLTNTKNSYSSQDFCLVYHIEGGSRVVYLRGGSRRAPHRSAQDRSVLHNKNGQLSGHLKPRVYLTTGVRKATTHCAHRRGFCQFSSCVCDLTRSASNYCLSRPQANQHRRNMTSVECVCEQSEPGNRISSM
jgi:hypothetical protein